MLQKLIFTELIENVSLIEVEGKGKQILYSIKSCKNQPKKEIKTVDSIN